MQFPRVCKLSKQSIYTNIFVTSWRLQSSHSGDRADSANCKNHSGTNNLLDYVHLGPQSKQPNEQYILKCDVLDCIFKVCIHLSCVVSLTNVMRYVCVGAVSYLTLGQSHEPKRSVYLCITKAFVFGFLSTHVRQNGRVGGLKKECPPQIFDCQGVQLSSTYGI